MPSVAPLPSETSLTLPLFWALLAFGPEDVVAVWPFRVSVLLDAQPMLFNKWREPTKLRSTHREQRK